MIGGSEIDRRAVARRGGGASGDSEDEEEDEELSAIMGGASGKRLEPLRGVKAEEGSAPAGDSNANWYSPFLPVL